ncbi:MAG: HD domain-containing protein [Myxococcales bacterium]|nr:HD domain-containing protein [Myxococcales bacterium]
MVRLSVISGPDAGKRATFNSAKISIGRGPGNDFALRDGLVSQHHGELVVNGDAIVYRDLQSRHGTLVRLNDLTINLHDREQRQDVELAAESHIIIGETLVQIERRRQTDQRDLTNGIATLLDEDQTSGFGERVVKRATESLDAVTRRLINRDPRLVSIFKLSRSLNTVTELDGILQLIVETTFEAFPAANFFAISVPSGDDDPHDELMKPLLIRERGKSADVSTGKTLLSHTLLRQVFESQESVLFVRDSSGIAPTESIINARIAACMAAPLVGQRRLLGVMQADTRGMGGLFGPDDLDLFTVLASYTAFAIERVNLTRNIYEMFEGVVRLSVTAIDARDPSTAGHSERVADFTVRLAERADRTSHGPLRDVRFAREEVTELRYAALLHDFGKVGVRESVLMKGARLTPDALEIVRERFEAARANVFVDAYRLAFERAERLQWSAGETRDYAEQLARRRVHEINEAEQYVVDHQPGRRLSQEAIEAMHAIAGMTFTDTAGRVRALLTRSELEDMTIVSGTLNAREWEDMRSHARKSFEFLCQIPWNEDLSRIPMFARFHHEKLDGSGYPDGLRGSEIPMQVRILTIADIFDAMTAADRPYRKAASVDRALQVLQDEARAGLLDSDLVDLFARSVLPELVELDLVGTKREKAY